MLPLQSGHKEEVPTQPNKQTPIHTLLLKGLNHQRDVSLDLEEASVLQTFKGDHSEPSLGHRTSPAKEELHLLPYLS